MSRNLFIDILAYTAVLLNMLFYGWWYHVASGEGTHAEIVSRFSGVLPFREPFNAVFLFLLTIFSLIVLARKKTVFPKILAGLQALFVFMYIWGTL